MNSTAIVKHELREDQVELIKRAVTKQEGITGKVTIPRETLEYLYVELKLSSLEIAQLLDVSKPSVLRRMRELGIRRRTAKEATALSTTHRSITQPTGEGHPWWQGGTRMKVGYLQTMMKDHPEADRFGYIFVHRLVAEQKIGRLLEPDEEVHHINGIRTDNRPENLEVMSKSEHMRLHANQKHASKLDNFGFGRMSHEK